MPIRFAALGSGSRGNALVVEHDGYRLLVDCGFGLAESVRRLHRLGLEPSDLHAILVTHEHDDHIGGVARLAARYNLPVRMTAGTLRGMEQRFVSLNIDLIEGYQPFSLGGIGVTPYAVPHDAREPTQFVFTDGRYRVGLLTDAGSITPHMVNMLAGCHALMLECNHDAGMLRQGRYPEPLKRRISGKWGHLDNTTATQILREVRTDQLQVVVGMHLSEENNHPDLVHGSIREALGRFTGEVSVAHQDIGTPWISLPG